MTEETSAEISDKNSNTNSLPKETWNILPPDEGYPPCNGPKHFFSPIRKNGYVDGWGKHLAVSYEMSPHDGQLAQLDGLAQSGPPGFHRDQLEGVPLVQLDELTNRVPVTEDLITCEKGPSDLLVKTDNGFTNFSQESRGKKI